MAGQPAPLTYPTPPPAEIMVLMAGLTKGNQLSYEKTLLLSITLVGL